MPRLVIQEHHARSPHFDFRLEKDGVFKSWALPKGIPERPGVRRLAVQVDDHELSFGDFEGEIPSGEYGAGIIRIWDCGHYILRSLEENRILFEAHGSRMVGRFSLVRFHRGNSRKWLLVKHGDHAIGE